MWEWFQAQETCTYITNNGIADSFMLADEALSDSVKVVKHVELRNHLVWKNGLGEFWNKNPVQTLYYTYTMFPSSVPCGIHVGFLVFHVLVDTTSSVCGNYGLHLWGCNHVFCQLCHVVFSGCYGAGQVADPDKWKCSRCASFSTHAVRYYTRYTWTVDLGCQYHLIV